MSRSVLLAGVSLLVLSSAAVAQTQLSPIVVTAPLQQSQDDLAEATTVLQGADLDRRRATTLGETLDGTPGVTSTQFGPGAGRPIIRGQGGPRVRVLNNGVDTFDASTTSPDHAVIAPVNGAQKIEVLRGPATLLYGSSAIGGVVNVIDGRIPDVMPKDGTAGNARIDYGSGAKKKRLRCHRSGSDRPLRGAWRGRRADRRRLSHQRLCQQRRARIRHQGPGQQHGNA